MKIHSSWLDFQKRQKVATSVHLLLEIKPKSGSSNNIPSETMMVQYPQKIMCEELQMYMFKLEI
jgi:hypothetical protein